MHLRLIATIATAVIAGATLAGTLFGTVKDDKDKPVANAEVKVYGKDDLKTKSDANGKFKIESKDLLDGNKYSVTVTADGYDSSPQTAVEMFDNPKDMDPIEVKLYKPEPVPASWTNEMSNPFARGSVSGGMMRANPNMPPPGWRPSNADTNAPALSATNNVPQNAAKPPAPAVSNVPPAAAKPAK